jgi:hypothetical protein
VESPESAPVWLRGTVAIGAGLKNRLEQVARPQGCDADYYARQVLREHLAEREPPPPERNRDE